MSIIGSSKHFMTLRTSAISLALSKPKQRHTDNTPKIPLCYSKSACKLHKVYVQQEHDPKCKTTKNQQRCAQFRSECITNLDQKHTLHVRRPSIRHVRLLPRTRSDKYFGGYEEAARQGLGRKKKNKTRPLRHCSTSRVMAVV